MKLTKMYFGRNKPDGTMVRMYAFNEFIKNEVATLYDKFIVTHATAYQDGAPEESFTIEVITDPIHTKLDFRPSQIANVYKQRFNQEDVLITVQDVEKV